MHVGGQCSQENNKKKKVKERVSEGDRDKEKKKNIYITSRNCYLNSSLNKGRHNFPQFIFNFQFSFWLFIFHIFFTLWGCASSLITINSF